MQTQETDKSDEFYKGLQTELALFAPERGELEVLLYRALTHSVGRQQATCRLRCGADIMAIVAPPRDKTVFATATVYVGVPGMDCWDMKAVPMPVSLYKDMKNRASSFRFPDAKEEIKRFFAPEIGASSKFRDALNTAYNIAEKTGFAEFHVDEGDGEGRPYQLQFRTFSNEKTGKVGMEVVLKTTVVAGGTHLNVYSDPITFESHAWPYASEEADQEPGRCTPTFTYRT